VSAEGPIIATGAVAIAAGYAREGGWPAKGTTALVSTALLVVFASFTSRTKAAPLVAALAWLMLIAALLSAVPFFGHANTKKAG